MNRVRIVAIIAASVGAAIAAGAFFGDEATLDMAQTPVAEPRPEPSLVGLAEPGVTRPEDSGPAVTQANLIPAPTVPLPPREVPLTAPIAQSPSLIGPMPQTLQPEGQIAALDPATVQGTDGLLGTEHLAAPALPTMMAEPLELAQEDASGIDPDILSQINACALFVVATPEAGAMLEVSVFAPCDGGATITVTHGGMQFEDQLSAEGLFMATVPALSEPAEVSVAFADGRTETDTTQVPDFDGIERLVLQWDGPVPMALLAWEDGAEQPISPQSPLPPVGEAGGSLMVLGLPGGAQAQVYTWPAGLRAASEDVALEVEVAITPESCGQEVNVHSMLVRADDAVRQHAVSFTMPACDGTGGYLLLHNLLPEVTLARN
jgi:hypothetical protein